MWALLRKSSSSSLSYSNAPAEDDHDDGNEYDIFMLCGDRQQACMTLLKIPSWEDRRSQPSGVGFRVRIQPTPAPLPRGECAISSLRVPPPRMRDSPQFLHSNTLTPTVCMPSKRFFTWTISPLTQKQASPASG